MPELPEVETMVRGIRSRVVGKIIRSVERCVNHCRPISVLPSVQKLKKRLTGQHFTGVRRIGKRVVIDVSDNSTLVIEPRMTGLVLLADPPDFDHLRLKWEFEGSNDCDHLYFWDRRGLGVVQLFEPGLMEIHLGPNKLGPDALSISVEQWIERCSKTRRDIKVLLLDQKTVAGIGNLYASEILHVARISPQVPSDSLNRHEIRRLNTAVKNGLNQGDRM